MDRRTYLATAGLTLTTSMAGCPGALGDSHPNTYLAPPDRSVDGDKLPFPTYGDPVPDVTLPAVLHDTTVTTTGFDRHLVMTFVYTHCKTICPVLTSVLRNIQTDASNEGYADEVAFLETTFDPVRDTADRFRVYAEQEHIDLNAGNWYFLRPKTEKRAKSVVEDKFGVHYEKTHPKNMDMYMYNHLGLILLVNKDGYVERAYSGSAPHWQSIRDDLTTLRKKSE